MKARRFDTFPFCGTETELLLLECRLTELYDTVDAFVIVEANVDHMDNPKPLNYLEHKARFEPWADKIEYVIADRLPTMNENDWFWSREHAQREYIGAGLERLDAQPNDIVLQSDADEIPRPLAVRNVNPNVNCQVISFHQKGHFWAVDWLHPNPWGGTTACRFGHIDELRRESVSPFAAMRDARNMTRPANIPNAGWHFSWLGGKSIHWETKKRMFCHSEQMREWTPEYNFANGVHPTDRVKMRPVEVDSTYPKWMQDPKNIPASWRRPR